MNARWVGLKALELMVDEDLFINAAVDKVMFGKEMEKSDRAFVKRLVYGTVENRIQLDYIIDLYSKTRTGKMKLTVLMVLRMAVYQLLYMPSIHNGAVINEAVKLIKKRKMFQLTGFVNGVLRNISKNIDKIEYPSENENPVKAASVRYSFPETLIELLLENHTYEELKAFLAYTHTAAPLSIRANTRKTTVENLKKTLEKEGLKVEQGAFGGNGLRLSGIDRLFDLEAFQSGLFQVQDESSMLVGSLSGIQEGDKVLDLCAAPGGKATHAAELTGPGGSVIACDISDRKLALIEENRSRLGLPWMAVEQSDASRHREDFDKAFDVVLADLPCSGLGIIRKKPDIKWQMNREKVASLVALQREMLTNAAAYVKNGGDLVFSTCTMTKEENEDNADWFLEKFKAFESVPLDVDGYGDSCGRIRIKPWETGTDGFFIARFRKKGEDE